RRWGYVGKCGAAGGLEQVVVDEQPVTHDLSWEWIGTSAADGAAGDALDEIALEREEEQQARHAEHGDTRHAEGEALDLGMRADLRREGRDADGERLHRIVEDDQQGPEKVIPVEGEEDDGGGDHRRAGQRQADAPEDEKMPGPVDARGILEVGGKLEEELAEDVDGEDISDAGQDERLIGIGP